MWSGKLSLKWLWAQISGSITCGRTFTTTWLLMDSISITLTYSILIEASNTIGQLKLLCRWKLRQQSTQTLIFLQATSVIKNQNWLGGFLKLRAYTCFKHKTIHQHAGVRIPPGAFFMPVLAWTSDFSLITTYSSKKKIPPTQSPELIP